jgi:signal transduction histidine kinase
MTGMSVNDVAAVEDILASLASAGSLPEILARFADKLAKAVSASTCTIFGWNRQGDALTVLASYVAAGADLAERSGDYLWCSFPLADYPAQARLLDDRISRVIHWDEPTLEETEKPFLRPVGLSSLLRLPMLRNQRAIGLIELCAVEGQPYRFGEEDVLLCQMLANQAALVIENAHLREEVESRRLRTRLFHAISEALALEKDYQGITEHVVEFAQRLLDAELVFWIAPAADADRFTVVSCAGRAASNSQSARVPSALLDWSLWKQVVQSKQPMVVPDVTGVAAWNSLGQPAEVHGIRSLAAVPLLSGDETLAVLVACAGRPVAFVPEDVVLLSGVASRAVISIQNVELSAKLEAQYQVLRRISLRMVNAQEEERRHLSRELHDELGQALTALKINLDLARRALPADAPAQVSSRLVEASSLAVSVLEKARSLSLKFHPAILDDLGLVSALRWEVDRYEQRTGQSVDFEADLSDVRLRPELEITIYRVVTEALTNVMRHAQAGHVRVLLRAGDGQIVAGVEDDGVGFDAANWFDSPSERRSLGLIGMRERTGLLGGQLEVVSAPGCGTRVQAVFPVDTGPPSRVE